MRVLIFNGMTPPLKPNEEDCCHSGCNPCIFDIYEKRLREYKTDPNFGNNLSENAISEYDYNLFTVIISIDLCESHKLLAFKKTINNDRAKVFWKPGQHFLYKYKNNHYSCTRAFTPIKMILSLEKVNYDFSIIVKRYTNGIVSNQLFNLSLEQETLWRGPYGNYSCITNEFSRKIMIAQGTGITPLISIIQNILNNEDDITRIILYFCCQSIDTIILRDELYSYKSYWNFTYRIFLKDHHEELKYQEPVENRKLCPNDISELKPFSQNDQFLLCGSNKFMEYYEQLLKITNNVFVQNIIKL